MLYWSERNVYVQDRLIRYRSIGREGCDSSPCYFTVAVSRLEPQLVRNYWESVLPVS